MSSTVDEIIALPEFSTCLEELRTIKANLDISEEEYQRNIADKTLSDIEYMNKEIEGTLQFDYYIEEMEDVVYSALVNLKLDVSLTRPIITRITGIRL